MQYTNLSKIRENFKPKPLHIPFKHSKSKLYCSVSKSGSLQTVGSTENSNHSLVHGLKSTAGSLCQKTQPQDKGFFYKLQKSRVLMKAVEGEQREGRQQGDPGAA